MDKKISPFKAPMFLILLSFNCILLLLYIWGLVRFSQIVWNPEHNVQTNDNGTTCWRDAAWLIGDDIVWIKLALISSLIQIIINGLYSMFSPTSRIGEIDAWFAKFGILFNTLQISSIIILWFILFISPSTSIEETGVNVEVVEDEVEGGGEVIEDEVEGGGEVVEDVIEGGEVEGFCFSKIHKHQNLLFKIIIIIWYTSAIMGTLSVLYLSRGSTEREIFLLKQKRAQDLQRSLRSYQNELSGLF